MVIELQRLYRDGWTDGLIFIKGILLCRSIELRWANNERNISCVPEGVYPVAIIQHPKFGECLQVNGVKGRSGILACVGAMVSFGVSKGLHTLWPQDKKAGKMPDDNAS
jgi:Family of unknown function (DUF5675)